MKLKQLFIVIVIDDYWEGLTVMVLLIEYIITDKALIKTENFEPHFCFDYMNMMQVFAHAIYIIH